VAAAARADASDDSLDDAGSTVRAAVCGDVATLFEIPSGRAVRERLGWMDLVHHDLTCYRRTSI
jgi:hypothetical protein